MTSKIVQWYEAYQAWPPGLKTLAMRLGHATATAISMILADYIYLDHSLLESAGLALIAVLSGQGAMSMKQPRAIGRRTREADHDLDEDTDTTVTTI
jgi:hypothetical protein